MEYVEHKAIWWPDTVRICGRRLRPMTLGQLRLLEAVNASCLWAGNVGEHTVPDCALSVMILHRPWRWTRRVLARPWMRRFEVQRYLLRYYLARDRASLLAADAEAIDAFLAGELWTPDYFRKAGQAPSTFGSALCRATRLAQAVQEVGAICTPFRRRSIWDYTVREAAMACILSAEQQGAEFETREESNG